MIKIIYFDNAKNFKQASKELGKMRKVLESEEVTRKFAENEIQWNFILEKAPWWVVFWERMVRSVKTLLKKTIGKALLTFSEL